MNIIKLSTLIFLVACGVSEHSSRVNFVSVKNPIGQETKLVLADLDTDITIHTPSEKERSFLAQMPGAIIQNHELLLKAGSGIVALTCETSEDLSSLTQLSQFKVSTSSKSEECSIIDSNFNGALLLKGFGTGIKESLEKKEDRDSDLRNTVAGPAALTASGIILTLVAWATLKPQLDLMSDFVKDFSGGIVTAGAGVASAASEIARTADILKTAADGVVANTASTVTSVFAAFIEAQQVAAQIKVTTQNTVAQSQSELLDKYLAVAQETNEMYLRTVNETGTLDQKQKQQQKDLDDRLNNGLNNDVAYTAWLTQINWIKEQLKHSDLETKDKLNERLISLQKDTEYSAFVERQQKEIEEVKSQERKAAQKAQQEEELKATQKKAFDFIKSLVDENVNEADRNFNRAVNRKTVDAEELIRSAEHLNQSTKKLSKEFQQVVEKALEDAPQAKKSSSIFTLPVLILAGSAFLSVSVGLPAYFNQVESKKFISTVMDNTNEALQAALEEIKNDDDLRAEFKDAFGDDRRTKLSALIRNRFIKKFNQSQVIFSADMKGVNTFLPGSSTRYLSAVRMVPERGEGNAIEFVAVPK
jgi:hypothetical protein